MHVLIIGFHDIIPAELVSIFSEQELELLISGLPDIDIEDWKAHSTYVAVNFVADSSYTNYDASSPQIQWFWRAVRSFNKEERAKLLQFATGTSKVPLNGFKELEGIQGTSPLMPQLSLRHNHIHHCERLWFQNPSSAESYLLQPD
jgi:E3 ubiquitin-protein ligase HUWE1